MNLTTILYVDDEPINLLLFQKMFSKKYAVIAAESGLEGLEILKDKPDLAVVISDMKMPQMNGIEFISKARSLYPEIHYYILTGYEVTPQIQEALDTGLILKYFRKPFKLNDIVNAIQANLLNT